MVQIIHIGLKLFKTFFEVVSFGNMSQVKLDFLSQMKKNLLISLMFDLKNGIVIITRLFHGLLSF